ncbi:hypothetical protein SOHN41_00318 [Shewanella sp. HN-41]|nr:hypothetical protein SOHN41_00318 [Shewanella sp. HN-41]
MTSNACPIFQYEIDHRVMPVLSFRLAVRFFIASDFSLNLFKKNGALPS